MPHPLHGSYYKGSPRMLQMNLCDICLLYSIFCNYTNIPPAAEGAFLVVSPIKKRGAGLRSSLSGFLSELSECYLFCIIRNLTPCRHVTLQRRPRHTDSCCSLSHDAPIRSGIFVPDRPLSSYLHRLHRVCTALPVEMTFMCSWKNSLVPFAKSMGSPYSDSTLQIWLKRSGSVSSLRISR